MVGQTLDADRVTRFEDVLNMSKSKNINISACVCIYNFLIGQSFIVERVVFTILSRCGIIILYPHSSFILINNLPVNRFCGVFY